jgi:hypothetical protein
MHGRPAEPGEDHAPFFYPLYALIFVAPLCVTKNYPVVQAIWMTLMLYVVLIGTLVSIRVARWKPPRWLWGLTLIWTVVNYPHARAILLGQFNLLVFLSIGLALLFLHKGSDTAAGAVLAIATVKPQVSFLVIPWLLWWTAHQRRYAVWKGFAIAMGAAVGLSLLIVPTWPLDFVRQVTAYDSLAGTPYHSLSWIIFRHLLGLGSEIETLATTIAGIVVAGVAWRFRQAQGDGMLWATAMVLLLGNFIASRVATTAYPVLLYALFMLFRIWNERLKSHWPVLITQVFLLFGQWSIFLLTIDDSFETAPAYLLFPLFMLIALLVTRPTLVKAPVLADGSNRPQMSDAAR